MSSALRTHTPQAARSGGSALGLSLLLGLVTSVLLDFCFSLAGPQRPWQPLLAWIALVPLLWALLASRNAVHPRYLRRAALTGYLCGVLWYILNCYWIYRTMLLYGVNFPAIAAAGILFLFSAILGLYFGLFGLILAWFRRRFGLGPALILAPFLWTAIDLGAARITSVPWDQLGYSQVNNLWITRLAPVTGVYGITFVLVAVNAVLAAALLAPAGRARISAGATGIVLAFVFSCGSFISLAPSPTSAYAVLLQPNNNVESDQSWHGTRWNGSVTWLIQQLNACPPYYKGMPLPGKSLTTVYTCAPKKTPPGVVLWPETYSWFASNDPETLSAMSAVAHAANAPLIVGMLGIDLTGIHNSALFVRANGSIAGRYDKIHLVPFGEYVPYESVFFFAKTLTHQLSHLKPGHDRVVFRTGSSGIPGGPARRGGHSFGAFICYESIFGNEIRQFARNGAQTLVNLSDDGWYGDTSAPWQHLDMTRMRAIENHRWLLLDTNNGLTTVVDPRGRVTFSAPRHTLTSLVARYGYETDLTFYTVHGDVFAWFCVVLSLGTLAWSVTQFSSRRTVSRTGKSL